MAFAHAAPSIDGEVSSPSVDVQARFVSVVEIFSAPAILAFGNFCDFCDVGQNPLGATGGILEGVGLLECVGLGLLRSFAILSNHERPGVRLHDFADL
eukprot:4381061-Prymnesium_polylepis.1